jgi:hypothetical protein
VSAGGAPGLIAVNGVEVSFDPTLGLYCIFLSVARREVVDFKLLVESYEGIAVARSLDPRLEPSRALVCLLAVADSIEATRAMLAGLAAEGYDARVIAADAAMLAKARTDLDLDPA